MFCQFILKLVLLFDFAVFLWRGTNKKSKNRTEKPPGSRGWTRLVPAPSYILGRGAGNLNFFQCCSTLAKPTKHPKKPIPNCLPSPWELLLWREPVLPAEPSGAGGGRAERGTPAFPQGDPFHFPPPRRSLMGWGEGGEAPHTPGVQIPKLLCPDGVVHPSVVSRVIPLARVSHSASHPSEVPEAAMAIHSLNPRKREGNPSPSLSLLPLVRFNASWNVHSLFLSGCTGRNIWKALSKQLIWGEKVIILIWDGYLDLKQQHREGYFVCNLTRSAQDFPTVLFLQM